MDNESYEKGFHTSKELLKLSQPVTGRTARSGFHTSKELLKQTDVPLKLGDIITSFHTSKELLKQLAQTEIPQAIEVSIPLRNY